MKYLNKFSYLKESIETTDLKSVSQLIIDKLIENGLELEDIYFGEKKLWESVSFSIVGKCPIQIHYTDRGKNVLILFEKEGVTDSMGSFSVDNIDTIVEVISDFEC